MPSSLLRRLFRPEPTELSVPHDGEVYRLDLRRRAGARRLTLRVSAATGRVVLTIPGHIRLATARTFAESQAGWIAARLARVPERLGFEPGRLVLVRDVPHRILRAPEARAATRIGLDADGAPAMLVGGTEAAVPGRVRRFLRDEAERDLRVAVDRYTAALGLAARTIAIRDTRSRWGSCSSSGTLSFSWRLIMAPPLVLDYLAAHEVAHLREMNHSPRYWTLLHDLCPGTQVAERWLKRHGAGLHRYG